MKTFIPSPVFLHQYSGFSLFDVAKSGGKVDDFLMLSDTFSEIMLQLRYCLFVSRRSNKTWLFRNLFQAYPRTLLCQADKCIKLFKVHILAVDIDEIKLQLPMTVKPSLTSALFKNGAVIQHGRWPQSSSSILW